MKKTTPKKPSARAVLARLFGATFLLFTALAQQTHAWSHLKRGDVPPLVLALQDAGVLISCRAHGAHHRAPFSCQYCIVSGIWNDALDAGAMPLPAAVKALMRTAAKVMTTTAHYL